MADTGHGSSITFGTSGFTADFTMFDPPEFMRPVLDDSDLSTSNYRTKVPGDLADIGEMECEFWFDPDEQPPVTGAAETVTLTFPVPSGSSNGATLAGTGFVSKWKAGQLKTDELMSATCTVQFDGKTEPAWTDAS